MAKNRCRCEHLDELFECGLLSVCPVSYEARLPSIFETLQEEVNWSHYPGKVEDKPAIEITESKKNLDVSIRLGSRPLRDGFDPFWVHPDAIRANDETKIFNLGLVERTLLGVGV
jgi:hypothetical protein